MSLILIDLAYIGSKLVVNIGYYLCKGTYNTVNYIRGKNIYVENTKTEHQLLIEEIKYLRSELNEIKYKNVTIKEIPNDEFIIINN